MNEPFDEIRSALERLQEIERKARKDGSYALPQLEILKRVEVDYYDMKHDNDFLIKRSFGMEEKYHAEIAMSRSQVESLVKVLAEINLLKPIQIIVQN